MKITPILSLAENILINRKSLYLVVSLISNKKPCGLFSEHGIVFAWEESNCRRRLESKCRVNLSLHKSLRLLLRVG